MPLSAPNDRPAPDAEPGGWRRLDVLVALLLLSFAAAIRCWASAGLEVPFDGATMLHRSLDLRDGVSVPLVGNQISGWPVRFGVFDDWYRAFLALGASDLTALTLRQAASHGLIAAWAWLLCARLDARGAGALLALWVALDERFINLAYLFPSTYRTAEWGLLLGVAIVALTSQHPRRGSGSASIAVLLAAGLVVPSHPFALAAAVPAGLVLARWGSVRRRSGPSRRHLGPRRR